MTVGKTERHNALVARLIREMFDGVDRDKSALNVVAESLLLGVGMLNFPADPRKQSLMIQEIANGAIDRTTDHGPMQEPR